MANMVKRNESEAFDLLVNIVDAYKFRDPKMLLRRIKTAERFLEETFMSRTESLEKQKNNNQEDTYEN